MGTITAAANTASTFGSGAVTQAVPDFPNAASLLATYGNFSEVAAGDFVTIVKTSNGQTITALSGGPLNPGESRVTLDVPVKMPCSLEIESSVIRARHQFSTVTLFSNSADGPDATPDPINIVSVYQSTADNGVAYNAVAGTIITLVLETALPAYPASGAVYLSDWINVTGLVDTRLNYPNLAIKFISADRKTITAGFSDELALPSLAVPAVTPTLGTAKVKFYNNMGGAHDGFGFRLTGTTATSAALVSVFGNGDAQVSGTLLGDHRVTIGSTAPVYAVGVNGQSEIRAGNRFRLEARPTECVFLDRPADSNTGWTVRATRTAVKPSQDAALRARFRLYQPENMTRPVAKILSIVKAGSTTWTVTTDGAHGLVTGNYVTVKGNRDQTNFAAFATPVAIIVTGANTLTLIGTTGTATGYGGSLILCNGGADQPGIIGQVVQSITIDANGWVTLVGNASWSGLAIGDYINLHGCGDNTTGANLGYDGAWEVASLATTSLVVKPIFNIFGVRVSPAATTLATTNCSGSIILRTTLRSHDLLLDEWSESRVMIDGAGTVRADKALPVSILGNVPVILNSGFIAGTVAVDAAIGNPVTVGLRASNANPTAMSATGDNVAALGTMIGAAVVKPFALSEAEWSYTGALTTTSDVAAQAAAGAGLKRHVTWFQATNTGASAVDVLLRDATTTRLQITVPAGQSVTFELPTGLPLTANAALNVALSAVGTVRVNLLGYTAP